MSIKRTGNNNRFSQKKMFIKKRVEKWNETITDNQTYLKRR